MVLKGFHGICIENNNIISKINNTDASLLSKWCNELNPSSIAMILHAVGVFQGFLEKLNVI